MRNLESTQKKIEATISHLQKKIQGMKQLAVGALYLVEYTYYDWRSKTDLYAHAVGILRGYAYSENGIRVSAVHDLLTCSEDVRSNSKNGEHQWSYVISEDLVVGSTIPITKKLSHVPQVTTVREIPLEELPLYINDAVKTGTYQKYLSGVKQPKAA